MKNYEEMAKLVLEARDDYVKKKNQRVIMVKKVSAIAFGMAAIVGVFVLKGAPVFMDRHSGTPDYGNISSDVVTTQSAETYAPTATTANATAETAAAVQTTQSGENYTTETQAVQTTQAVQSPPETTAVDRVQTTAAVATNHEGVNTTAAETPTPQQTTVPETVQATQTTATGTGASETQAPATETETTVVDTLSGYRFYTEDRLYRVNPCTVAVDMISEEPIEQVQVLDMNNHDYPVGQRDMYSISGYSPDIMTAVYFPEADSYRLCLNMAYRPETVQEFLDGIFFKQKWRYVSSADPYGEPTQYTGDELTDIVSSVGKFKSISQFSLRDFIMEATFESTEIQGCQMTVFFYGSGHVVFNVGVCSIYTEVEKSVSLLPAQYECR